MGGKNRKQPDLAYNQEHQEHYLTFTAICWFGHGSAFIFNSIWYDFLFHCDDTNMNKLKVKYSEM